MNEITPDRLAETEYARFKDPAFCEEVRYGYFVHTPSHPKIQHANQLMDCRCPLGEEHKLFAWLENRYASTNLSFMKMCGHDTDVYERLKPLALERGWEAEKVCMTVWEEEPRRSPSSAVEVRIFDPICGSELQELSNPENPWREYEPELYQRLGGEMVAAYIDGKPVGRTGWHSVNGLARFYFILTAEHARGKGVATTMIRWIQERDAVKKHDALVIHLGKDGPMSLYEELGFRRKAILWELIKSD